MKSIFINILFLGVLTSCFGKIYNNKNMIVKKKGTAGDSIVKEIDEIVEKFTKDRDEKIREIEAEIGEKVAKTEKELEGLKEDREILQLMEKAKEEIESEGAKAESKICTLSEQFNKEVDIQIKEIERLLADVILIKNKLNEKLPKIMEGIAEQVELKKYLLSEKIASRIAQLSESSSERGRGERERASNTAELDMSNMKFILDKNCILNKDFKCRVLELTEGAVLTVGGTAPINFSVEAIIGKGRVIIESNVSTNIGAVGEEIFLDIR